MLEVFHQGSILNPLMFKNYLRDISICIITLIIAVSASHIKRHARSQYATGEWNPCFVWPSGLLTIDRFHKCLYAPVPYPTKPSSEQKCTHFEHIRTLLCVTPLYDRQWRGALMFSLICARINGWVNNCAAGYLRRYRAHYDAIVMLYRWVYFMLYFINITLTCGSFVYLFLLSCV